MLDYQATKRTIALFTEIDVAMRDNSRYILRQRKTPYIGKKLPSDTGKIFGLGELKYFQLLPLPVKTTLAKGENSHLAEKKLPCLPPPKKNIIYWYHILRRFIFYAQIYVQLHMLYWMMMHLSIYWTGAMGHRVCVQGS